MKSGKPTIHHTAGARWFWAQGRKNETEDRINRMDRIMNNIMLDLETLGNKPGAVIVAIGAVRFGRGQLGTEFYMRISATDAVGEGLTLDADTVLWWMKQSDAARAELNKPAEYLTTALQEFHSFCEPSKDAIVWGNGSDFDNVILAAAYQTVDYKLPWQFWNNRCYRTVKNLHPNVPMTRTGTAHNALEDAKSQALHLMQMLPNL